MNRLLFSLPGGYWEHESLRALQPESLEEQGVKFTVQGW
jgi:hypothetical protein